MKFHLSAFSLLGLATTFAALDNGGNNSNNNKAAVTNANQHQSQHQRDPQQDEQRQRILQNNPIFCDDLYIGEDLGNFTSDALPFQGIFPHVGGCDNFIKGRDNFISILVGGNLISEYGAEIEGKIVVLGDLIIDLQGAGSLVYVGVGTCVVPEDGQELILVGGNIHTEKFSSVMQIANGKVFYKGSMTGPGIAYQLGLVARRRNMDLSFYQDYMGVLGIRSKYWSSLDSNGEFSVRSGIAEFRAGDDDVLQVFNLDSDQLDFDFGTLILFDKSLNDRTILINIHATEEDGRVAALGNLANFYSNTTDGLVDGNPNFNFEFGKKVAASILWNFHDTVGTVKLGNLKHGNGEFIGSLLVPFSNLDFTMPGHSGRMIVRGNVLQNSTGCEFRNVEFDPPAHLPLPPPDFDILTAGHPTLSPTKGPTIAPTGVATPSPTAAPVTSDPTAAPIEPTTSLPTLGPVIPIVVEPTDPPVTDSPTTSAPVATSEPTAAPVAAATESPVTSSPTANSTAAAAATAVPVAFNPTTEAPVASNPTTAAPVASNPTTAAPVASDPATTAPVQETDSLSRANEQEQEEDSSGNRMTSRGAAMLMSIIATAYYMM